jgi:hypothetical protein
MSGSARALSPQLALVPLVIPLLGIEYGIVTNKVRVLGPVVACRLALWPLTLSDIQARCKARRSG